MLTVKKNGPGRPRLHKKRLRDFNAPKTPLSAYLQFVVDRRREISAANRLGPADVTEKSAISLLAAEWKALDPKIRNNYIKQYEQKRMTFRNELEEYRKTDSYKQFMEKIKERESEVRRLRAEIVRLEEEEEALKKNVNRLRLARDQSQTDLHAQQRQKDTLHRQLTAYGKVLLNSFAKFPLPGFEEGITSENMDDYLIQLQELITRPTSENQNILIKARDIVKRIKLPAF